MTFGLKIPYRLIPNLYNTYFRILDIVKLIDVEKKDFLIMMFVLSYLLYKTIKQKIIFIKTIYAVS